MDVLNFTPMPAFAAVFPGRDGRDRLLVVVKGTFGWHSPGPLRLSRTQESLWFADVPHGDPAASSTCYENDFASFKPACDVVVNGSAHAPAGERRTEVDVSFRFMAISKSARVFGDRQWQRGLLGGWSSTRPRPFESMPVRWERCFGGADTTAPDPRDHRYELRNLVGVGLYARNCDEIDGGPLPNVEDTAKPIQTWKDRPDPVGFGFVGRGWQPRIRYGGTYDQRWLDEICPFLPEDFDERYHQGAPADQVVPYPRGGEAAVLKGFTPEGWTEFRLPDLAMPVVAELPGGEVELAAVVDTVVIEPDLQRVLLTWRAGMPCPCKPTDVRRIRVGQATPAFTRARQVGKVFVRRGRTRPGRG